MVKHKLTLTILLLASTQALCFAQDDPVTKKRTWAVTRFRTVEKFQALEVDDISQGPEHLIGSATVLREKKESPQLVIQGHFNEIGEFTPNVSLAVSDRMEGDWKIIESSSADKVDVTLTGAPHIDMLFIRIQFDAFQPYIGKFKFCRVTLQTGETDVFPMEWLEEPKDK